MSWTKSFTNLSDRDESHSIWPIMVRRPHILAAHRHWPGTIWCMRNIAKPACWCGAATPFRSLSISAMAMLTTTAKVDRCPCITARSDWILSPYPVLWVSYCFRFGSHAWCSIVIQWFQPLKCRRQSARHTRLNGARTTIAVWLCILVRVPHRKAMLMLLSTSLPRWNVQWFFSG